MSGQSSSGGPVAQALEFAGPNGLPAGRRRIREHTSMSLRPATRLRSRPNRAAPPALALAGVVGLSLFASACGSSTGTGVAQIGSTQTTTSSSNSSTSGSRDDTKILVAYAACMRKHGVPNFPDPQATESGYHLVIGSENGIDPHSSQFKNAQQACTTLLPNGGKPSSQDQAKELQEALKYATCMRAHGVSKFPDPKLSANGELEMGLGRTSGVSPSSPRFKAAETLCVHLLPSSGGGSSRP
jgi:hypothetical protein